mmetsp:Transcript_54446/g.151690  ORF Transcript_54446/g.151690 Transcript_54446/m.151690 type:complete len:205 (-) Transcript_54446:46-660(-)
MGKVRQTRRRLAQFFNWRVSVTLIDGRVLDGTLMAVDKHVNLVLSNAEEYRRYKVKGRPEGKELKRMLGFVVCRGTTVLYVQPEELGKDELVETEKHTKKQKANAKAGASAGPPAGAAQAGKAAAMTVPPALLGGLGMRPPGLPDLAGLTALQGMPGLGGAPPPLRMPMPGMPGFGGLPGMPPGLPGLNPAMLTMMGRGRTMPM